MTITIIGGAMLVALIAGILLGLAVPVPDSHVGLPDDHPLQVLPGTRIIENGEYR